MQVVHIIVGNPFGPLASTPVLPAVISDGRIRAGDATYNLVPLPFEASAMLTSRLKLTRSAHPQSPGTAYELRPWAKGATLKINAGSIQWIRRRRC